MEFACTNCGSTEFIRLEALELDSSNLVAAATDERQIFKCANCGSRFHVDETRSVNLVQVSSQRSNSLPRVRSSVSAEERGIGSRDRTPRM